MFQLELPEGWAIHNVFNEDLLTRCNELQFKNQHMEPAPPPTIINKEKEYEVKSIGNKAKRHNILCIGKVIGMSMTNES